VNLEELGTTSSLSYSDTSIDAGIIYQYVIVKHFGDVSVFFTSTNEYPASTPYNITVYDNVGGQVYLVESQVTYSFYMLIQEPRFRSSVDPNMVDLTIEYELVLENELYDSGTFNSENGDFQLTEVGNYQVRVRVQSDIIQIWTEWTEHSFTVVDSRPTIPTTSSTQEDTPDAGIPIMTFLYTLNILLAVSIISRRLGRKHYNYGV
jgi:hypothetical protein